MRPHEDGNYDMVDDVKSLCADLRKWTTVADVGGLERNRELMWRAADTIEAALLTIRDLESPWAITKKQAIEPTHEAADAFWTYWRENGETHKHGYYESTWGAINAALNASTAQKGTHS